MQIKHWRLILRKWKSLGSILPVSLVIKLYVAYLLLFHERLCVENGRNVCKNEMKCAMCALMGEEFPCGGPRLQRCYWTWLIPFSFCVLFMLCGLCARCFDIVQCSMLNKLIEWTYTDNGECFWTKLSTAKQVYTQSQLQWNKWKASRLIYLFCLAQSWLQVRCTFCTLTHSSGQWMGRIDVYISFIVCLLTIHMHRQRRRWTTVDGEGNEDNVHAALIVTAMSPRALIKLNRCWNWFAGT